MVLRRHGVYVALSSYSSKVLTTVQHFGNRNISLSNAVANNCHFEWFEEMGGTKCNIKKVLILPIPPISLLLTTRRNLKRNFFLNFVSFVFFFFLTWHKDGSMCPDIR